MIPGRFHGETGAVIGIKAGEVRIIPLRVDGVAATAWYLPVGDTGFGIEVSDITLPASRPSRLIVDIVRKVDNRTNRCSRVMPSGGSPKWADVFGNGFEHINIDEGLVYFTIQHDGRSTVNVGLIVVDGMNPHATAIHELGGFNRWSDGTIR
jgi:hypothetical protein